MKDVNNHLKDLQNNIPATFVYAGIGCEALGFFSEGKSESQSQFSQTRNRFVRYEINPYENNQEWIELLKFVESRLVLTESFPGMLHVKLANYLFERTGGVIGSLMALIKTAAVKSIMEKFEVINKALLSSIQLDHGAETQEIANKHKRQRAKKWH